VQSYLHCKPDEGLLLKEWHGIELKESSIPHFLELYTTFLELNKLCPRAKSLYAFFETIDLQREYSVHTCLFKNN
jgi:hypothetical protein